MPIVLLYWMVAIGYALNRTDYEGKTWLFVYTLLLNIFAFPCVIGADTCRFLKRPAPNYEFVTNIHNHTDGDVTITKL